MRKRMISLLCVLALCLTLLPSTAWAAGSAYTESTDGTTTTYTFYSMYHVNAANSYGDQTFRVDADGDVVLDFTHVPQSEVSADKAEFILDLTNKVTNPVTVTVKGNPAIAYHASITINSKSYGGNPAAAHTVTLNLVDFQTDKGVKITSSDADNPATICFDGACRVYNVSSTKNLILMPADEAAHLDLLYGCSNGTAGAQLRIEGGSYTFQGSGIDYPTAEIKDADIHFLQSSNTYSERRTIRADQLTITGSTIRDVAMIYSKSNYEYAQDNSDYFTFKNTFIKIIDSSIAYAEDAGTLDRIGMLCNSETITMEGSLITGSTQDYGAQMGACIGGIFKTLIIKGSRIYIESDNARITGRRPPAIGPDEAAYKNYMGKLEISEPSITIEDSIVEAAARDSAAIGLPSLNPNSNIPDDLPKLSITIKGNSSITASSVNSPAIGGANVEKKVQDDGRVELIVPLPGISGWEGKSSETDVGLGQSAASSASLYSADENILSARSGSSPLEDIENDWQLLDGCTITIESTDSGTPTIHAKSGVLAVYAGSVTVTDTNLVQATMVQQAGSSWSVYPMETAGDVTIDRDTIGQMGYGYASVASTDIGAQTDVAMKFGTAELKSAEGNVSTFTVDSTGFQRFFVTPALALYGTVTLTGDNDNGTAAVDTTLTADISELLPTAAKGKDASGSYSHLTFTWYADGTQVQSGSGKDANIYEITGDDASKVITCVVSVQDSDTMFTGSVTSSAVLVGTASLAAPTLASRTEDSITLNTMEDCQYGILTDRGIQWQDSAAFSGLESGTAYTFILKDSSNNLSVPATFYTMTAVPAAADFSIDYEAERLTFPTGVNLYSDKDCTVCLNADTARNWIGLSGLIPEAGEGAAVIYARYGTVPSSDTDSVMEITIPARPGTPTLSQIERTSTSISFTGESGVTYRLITADGSQVGNPQSGDGGQITFDQLQPGTEYTLQMRVDASNDNTTFQSAIGVANLRTIGTYTRSETLLAAVGDTERSYDLTGLLGGLNITNVEKTDDSFVTNATDSSNTVTLTFDTISTAEDEATVTVTATDADNTLTLTLTVKAVEVMAEKNGVFWVKSTEESSYPGYVNISSPNTLISYWNSALNTAELGSADKDTFALLPQYIVGGGAANVTDSPEITYQSSSLSAAKDWAVLCIPVGQKAAVELSDAQKTDAQITFNAKGSNALYLVAALGAQTPTVNAELKKDGATANTFLYDDTLTAEITVSGTGSTPTGTAELHLGSATGTQLGNTATLDGSGKATITYLLDDTTILSGTPQALYVVYSGDTIYSTASKEIENITLKAGAPDAPAPAAQAQVESVTLTWTAPGTHGAAITGYKLAVTDADNKPITGSPFTIAATQNTYTVQNLTGGITYTFVLTAESDAGNTDSDSVTATPLSAASCTILAAAGTAGEKTYDLSQWLGSTVTGAQATETTDADNIISNVEMSGSSLTVTYGEVKAGSTATLTVIAGTTMLTLTVEAVDVMAQTDTVFWVKNDGAIMISEQAALTNYLSSLGMEDAAQDTFALLPRTIVGGGTAAPTEELPNITVNVTESLEDCRVVVLYVQQDGTNVTELTPAASGDNVTFHAKAQNGLYMVAYKEMVQPSVSVTLKNGGTKNAAEFLYGDTLTAEITVSGTGCTPTGTVELHLGSTTGTQLGDTATLDNGKATITYSLNDTTILSDTARTLYAVYSGDTIYETASEEVTGITLKAAAPNAPVLAAQAQVNAVTLTWNAPATHGAAITGYELAVTNADGNAITGSPFSIEATENTYIVQNLTGGLEYTFVLTAKSGAGDVTSNSVTATPTAEGTGIILLPAGASGERTYDLSSLLGGRTIQTVHVGTDSEDIVKTVAGSATALTVTCNAAADGDTATLAMIVADETGAASTLTLTVKAVIVLAEQEGVFFVQEIVSPSLVGITDQQMTDAWSAAKAAQGFQSANQHSFAVQPRIIVGGNVTTVESAAVITWTPDTSMGQTPVAEGSFLVLRIGKNETAASAILYQRTADSLIFSAGGETALYAVVYQEATGGAVTVSAELQKNGTAASSFRYGDTLTAVVTIEPSTTAAGLKPGGTVYLYLGDPANGGKLLASGQMNNGSGTITYTLNDESILSNAEQTLYIVYPGDNNYLAGQITVKAYLQPAPSGGGSGITTYPVTVVETEHGTVTVSPKSAAKGKSVTVATVPDEGYELVSLTVTDQNSGKVAVTDIGGGTFTFQMPGGKVTVEAIFAAISPDYAACDGGSDCPLWDFTDLNVNAWYHDGVHFCIDEGLMEGYGGGLFGPNAPLSRAQLCKIVYNMEGRPAVTSGSTFTDVAAGSWYEDAINWAAANDIVEGYGDGNFGPDDPITREQLAAILWRYAKYKGYDVSVGEDTNILSYTDAFDVAEYAIPAMQWAVGTGVTEGVTESTLVSQGNATRAQAATMLMRFCVNVVKD